MKQLAKGVNLHLIPSKKFKTISIKFKFKNKLDIETITKRSMVARLLETNSQAYPSQTLFQSKLSDLYGTQFSSGVSKTGNYHILTFAMNVVNEKFLQDQGIFDQALSFFHQALFKPNSSQGQFHQATFEREIRNLRDDFAALYDDKASYAQIQLLKSYFKDPAQQALASGRSEDLDQLTAENVYQSYQQMIDSDELDIFILGDIDQKSAEQALSAFDFKDRQTDLGPVFYEQDNDADLIHNEEVQEVNQAKLNMAYETGVYYHDQDFYALQVFNGIFGGFPHSKLFMNVREKESLAYTAASRTDTFRGLLFVYTGIDKSKYEQVLQIVDQQIKDMQAGNFEDEVIDQTKEMLKNGLMQSDDSAHSYIERQYALALVDQELRLDEWMDKIDQVSRQDIIDVAQKVKLQATFLLKGE